MITGTKFMRKGLVALIVLSMAMSFVACKKKSSDKVPSVSAADYASQIEETFGWKQIVSASGISDGSYVYRTDPQQLDPSYATEIIGKDEAIFTTYVQFRDSADAQAKFSQDYQYYTMRNSYATDDVDFDCKMDDDQGFIAYNAGDDESLLSYAFGIYWNHDTYIYIVSYSDSSAQIDRLWDFLEELDCPTV